MEHKEDVKAVGAFTVLLLSPSGEIKDRREITNLVTTAGKTALATWLAAGTQSTTFMPYIAVGTGTTAASASDTALQTEIARAAGTVTSSTNVFQNSVSMGPGTGTGAITEAGLLSAASNGTLFSHQVFSAVNKGASDTVVVSWSITFS